MSRRYAVAVVWILKRTVWPWLTLMSVANPWMLELPAPLMSHSLGGLPACSFSHTIGLQDCCPCRKFVVSSTHAATSATTNPRGGRTVERRAGHRADPTSAIGDAVVTVSCTLVLRMGNLLRIDGFSSVRRRNKAFIHEHKKHHAQIKCSQCKRLSIAKSKIVSHI